MAGKRRLTGPGAGRLAMAAALACAAFAAAASGAGARTPGEVDVRDFGAVGDGRTRNTVAIQRAIDACSAGGGGRVRVAGGTYMTGMVFLKDGVTIDLAPDGTLLGSPDDADYPTNAPLRHLDAAKSPRRRTTALIVADECRSVGITGTGTIDCNGDAFVQLSRNRGGGYLNDGNGDGKGEDLGDDWVNWRYRRIPGRLSPPRMVLFAGCEDVRVTDVKMVRPAAGWGYWVTDCDRVAFDRVRILADPQYPNNDGIHVNASRDVSIANCRIVAGDDAIVVRCNCRALPSVRPCERVTVVNCQLTSFANCIRIGWLNDGVIRDCTFSNLTMTDSACGIGVDLPVLEPGMDDYGCGASRYGNLVFSSIVMDRIYSAPVRFDFKDEPSARLDAIGGITFSDMRCVAYAYPTFRLAAGRGVSDIRFRGCSFVRCREGSFPLKWRQVGAAYWWFNDCLGDRREAPGVTYVDCTFENRDQEE